MKFLKIRLLFAIILLSINFLQAQTADDIINKYINAIGGREKLDNISTLYTECISEGAGSEMEIFITVVNGKGMKTEMNTHNGKNIVCFTDTSGWMINGIGGETAAIPLPMEMLKKQKDKMDILGPLYLYVAKGNKVSLLPSEKIGDINAYKIMVTSADSSNKTTYYFDPTTYYAVKITSEAKIPGKESAFVFTMGLSNYQKTDYGYVMPFTTEAFLPDGQGSMIMIVKKVEVNKMVDPKIFDMPK